MFASNSVRLCASQATGKFDRRRSHVANECKVLERAGDKFVASLTDLSESVTTHTHKASSKIETQAAVCASFGWLVSASARSRDHCAEAIFSRLCNTRPTSDCSALRSGETLRLKQRASKPVRAEGARERLGLSVVVYCCAAESTATAAASEPQRNQQQQPPKRRAQL